MLVTLIKPNVETQPLTFSWCLIPSGGAQPVQLLVVERRTHLHVISIVSIYYYVTVQAPPKQEWKPH
jgi:hypothetical protein